MLRLALLIKRKLFGALLLAETAAHHDAEYHHACPEDEDEHAEPPIRQPQERERGYDYTRENGQCVDGHEKSIPLWANDDDTFSTVGFAPFQICCERFWRADEEFFMHFGELAANAHVFDSDRIELREKFQNAMW